VACKKRNTLLLLVRCEMQNNAEDLQVLCVVRSICVSVYRLLCDMCMLESLLFTYRIT
jgi:hypothetical protein